MLTWLDTQPAAIFHHALDTINGSESGCRFALWLGLVAPLLDQRHLGQLHVGRHQLERDWGSVHDQSSSPPTAALAPRATHLAASGDPAGPDANLEWAARIALGHRESVVTAWPEGHDPEGRKFPRLAPPGPMPERL
ncbi:MAG: hypothetical protein M0Z46_16275 [Actinomycetota bacterium]|nr:hypothetical protein [Actinomycetota bacterium]